MVQFLQNPHANAVQEMLADIEARKEREKQMKKAYLISLISNQPYQRQLQILRANPELARGINTPEYTPTETEAADIAVANKRRSVAEGFRPDASDTNYAGMTLVTDKVPNQQWTEANTLRHNLSPVDFSAALKAPTKKLEAEAYEKTTEGDFNKGPRSQEATAHAGLYGSQSRLASEQATNEVQERTPGSPLNQAMADREKAKVDAKGGGQQKERGLAVARQALELIETMEKHPGFSGAVGVSPEKFGGLREKPLPATKAAGYAGYADRLRALMSIENLELMRGLGPMSEREFETINKIGTSLSTESAETDFAAELARAKAVIQGRLAAAETVPTPNDGTEWRKNLDGTYTRIK